jgi:hypothetical protein
MKTILTMKAEESADSKELLNELELSQARLMELIEEYEAVFQLLEKNIIKS